MACGYETNTVDDMVELVLEKMGENEVLRKEFQLQGDVKFANHLNQRRNPGSTNTVIPQTTIDQPSASAAMPQTTIDQHNRGKAGVEGKVKGGRRADRFCIYTPKDQAAITTFAIEYKAPHKLPGNNQ
jgi:hypothetical protein